MAAAAAAAIATSMPNRQAQPSLQLVPSPSMDLEVKLAALEVALAKRTNAAFVFIKPHAVNDKVAELVKDKLADAGIEVTSEGVLDHQTIDENLLIDTHYGAIATKAVKVKPADLAVNDQAKGKFKGMSGMEWDDAVKAGKVYNAAEACKKLGINGKQLDAKWSVIDKKTDLVKFGGGFYCGKLDEDMYVINGFYMAMRGKFTEPPARIHYFTVEWDAAALSWEDFRGKVLGATDPTTAAEGSLRRLILDNWQELGLASMPFTGDNGVHASASPFEALAERNNWVGVAIEEDTFGKTMIAAGIPVSTIKDWANDPQVLLGGSGKGSLFDTLEDTDTIVCLEKAKKLYSLNK